MQNDDTMMRGVNIPGYEIVEEVGRGGMAIVYKALQTSLGRYVALKILNPYLTADSELVKRFQMEAKAAASLKHPNIVTVYDVGEANGNYFIAMEYVEGKSLKEYLREQGKLPPAMAIRILKDIASALDYAHKEGFVHRDVKPSNVLIEEGTGRALLADFGVVKALHDGTHLTRSGIFVGTAQYSSPEQIQGREIDARSDLYSFGVMAYEMLSGKPPFEGPPTAVMHAHVYEPVPPLSSTRSGVPKTLDEMFWRSLAKSPEERYSSALEFVKDIEKAFHVAETWKTESTLQAVRKDFEDKRMTSVLGKGRRDKRIIRSSLAGILIGGLLILISLGFIVTSSQKQKYTIKTAAARSRATSIAMKYHQAIATERARKLTRIHATATQSAKETATAMAYVRVESTKSSMKTATAMMQTVMHERAIATTMVATYKQARATKSAMKTATAMMQKRATATRIAAHLFSCKVPVGRVFREVWGISGVRNKVRCPLAESYKSLAAEERFQHGFMLWKGATREIYVFFDDGTWVAFPDLFVAGKDPEYPCGIHRSPPSARRGFGKVWCSHPYIKSKIGYAVEREIGYGMPGGGPSEIFQDFEGGMMYSSNHFGVIYVLFSGDKSWKEFRFR